MPDQEDNKGGGVSINDLLGPDFVAPVTRKVERVFPFKKPSSQLTREMSSKIRVMAEEFSNYKRSDITEGLATSLTLKARQAMSSMVCMTMACAHDGDFQSVYINSFLATSMRTACIVDFGKEPEPIDYFSVCSHGVMFVGILDDNDKMVLCVFAVPTSSLCDVCGESANAVRYLGNGEFIMYCKDHYELTYGSKPLYIKVEDINTELSSHYSMSKTKSRITIIRDGKE